MEFKGSHFEKEIILWGVRWYVAYPLSYRQLEEMRKERGVSVDHATLNRWVIKYAPEVEQPFPVIKLERLRAYRQRSVKRKTSPNLLGIDRPKAGEEPEKVVRSHKLLRVAAPLTRVIPQAS